MKKSRETDANQTKITNFLEINLLVLQDEMKNDLMIIYLTFLANTCEHDWST